MHSPAGPVTVTLSLQRVKRKYIAECKLDNTVFRVQTSIAAGVDQGTKRAATARKQLAEQLRLCLKPHLAVGDIETITQTVHKFRNGRNNTSISTLAFKTLLNKTSPLKNQPAPTTHDQDATQQLS
ncbi:hypothetical protein Deipr_2636 (plasmid) [Deinococcus proteolyticus MRP]|uniref:Uncharacterized protein n=1 Tax=Deinococcus proteolyticus (strain ATCC 35074 / DSM 20540 / JCM 6276 / NBRC 101906 / NCIMB 13154 / VKM Ac-1939 / CCM 2703 / MRP) TaxID=693977 RepID=F0RR38_DEIPM|nr:hypothetical protein [Deinococcus proteolyticus]ADY27747.1 hypothetical protein Deipr_2636 [Deinococcus proteolyticus MRP]